MSCCCNETFSIACSAIAAADSAWLASVFLTHLMHCSKRQSAVALVPFVVLCKTVQRCIESSSGTHPVLFCLKRLCNAVSSHACIVQESISIALLATYGLPAAKHPCLFVGLTIVLTTKLLFLLKKGKMQGLLQWQFYRLASDSCVD